MAGRGRANPYKIDSDVGLNTVENLSGIGLNLESIAAIMGVARSTIYLHVKDNPAVKEAVQRGRAKAIAKVSQKAFEMAASGKHADMTKFWLKSMAGWQEKSTVELTASLPESEQKQIEESILAELTEEELAVFERILLKDKLLREKAGQEPLVLDVESTERD